MGRLPAAVDVWVIDDHSVLCLLKAVREMLGLSSEQRGYSRDIGAGTGKGQGWNPQKVS